MEVKETIREEPAADQADIYYTLVKEISKEQKKSAGIDELIQLMPKENEPVPVTE